MVFSSLYFIFIFLPAITALYYVAKKICPNKIIIRNIILCLFSLFFYAWGEPLYVLLMLLSIICNFFFAKSRSKAVFIIAIIFNLIFLFFFKYLGFAIENLNKMLSVLSQEAAPLKVPQLKLPIGISFYTFQALSYIIDVHRKKVEPQKNLISLALYISLFPQLIAGPIVRYTEIEREILERNDIFDNFINGLKDFILGLGCKVILANNLAVVADNILDSPQQACSGIVWLALLCYAFQIYFDFSGYSRMAIGLGKMFGFSFPENFNYPYCADSITDFWRRWHMTLSGWFRDYVYIPLGGNRVSVIKHIRNIIITWLFTGFWHGASWNFVFWGLYYGLLLIFEKYVTFRIVEKLLQEKMPYKIGKILIRLAALFLILFGWALFRMENLTQLAAVFQKMFSADGVSLIEFVSQHADTCSKLIFLIPAVICSLPVYKWIFRKQEMSEANEQVSKVSEVLELVWVFVIFLVSVCLLIASTYNPFIYFRF